MLRRGADDHGRDRGGGYGIRSQFGSGAEYRPLYAVTVPRLVGRVIFIPRHGFDVQRRLRWVARQQREGRPVRRGWSRLVGVRVHFDSLSRRSAVREGGQIKKGHHRFQVMALCVSVSLSSGYITR